MQDLIWAEIERVNAGFARVETIKKFRLIEQQLTAEDEELTPTMKLKRKFVNEKYKTMIDGMYAEQARASEGADDQDDDRDGDCRGGPRRGAGVALGAAARRHRDRDRRSACTPTCRARPRPTACRRRTP